MIQELKITNFLSFKDETVFSFEASKDSFAEAQQVVRINEKTRLLRFAILYGYNASGKSNLLKAFMFLPTFWNKKHDDPDESTDVTPFKLDTDTPHQPSIFELTFWVEGVKYVYKLAIDSHQVYEESLYNYTSSKKTMLFERSLKDNQSIIQFGPSLKVAKNTKNNISDFCLRNVSFFVARKKVNTNIQEIDKAQEWLGKAFMPGINPGTILTRYAQRNCVKEDTLIPYLLSFLREADFNIKNITTESVDDNLPEKLKEKLISTLPIEMKDKLSFTHWRTLFDHEIHNERGTETYQLKIEEDDEEESQGTIRTFGLETAIYELLHRHRQFLTIDEIETSLHPKLQERILYDFLKANSQSQMIVTTHNDGLMDLADDLFRKDSIWFTEKKPTGATDLFKLTDFKGVNRLPSIREAYRNKRFGATLMK